MATPVPEAPHTHVRVLAKAKQQTGRGRKDSSGQVDAVSVDNNLLALRFDVYICAHVTHAMLLVQSCALVMPKPLC